jgi:sigma-B regulation protein RsbU (phosphoserine phosphatase)
MAKLQTMMQLYCVDNRSPKEILVQINKKLYQEMEKSWFVTLSLAIFDMEKKTVKFCRAGHVPVLVSEKGKIDFYKTTGLGVGLEKGVIFEKTLIEEELQLKSGQVYTFFSDGITEGMNENEELFGEERLAEVLKNNSDTASSQIMNSVWNELRTYCGKTEQYDDQTMVIVKIK